MVAGAVLMDDVHEKSFDSNSNKRSDEHKIECQDANGQDMCKYNERADLSKNVSERRVPNLIYLMTVLSAMGGFLFGYDTGIVGGAMIFVEQVFQLDNQSIEVIVTVTIFGAFLFSLVAGRVCDSYGRKAVILLASVIFMIGSILMGAASNKSLLLIGRFTVGVAIGFASMAVPIYIAEVAPAETRGSLVTLNNCFITFGQLAASVTAGAFSYDKTHGWRWMLGLAAVPSAIQFIGFVFMPESPRWLLKRDKAEEALGALKRIRGNHNTVQVLREFDKIRHNTNELAALESKRKKEQRNLWLSIIRQPATRRSLSIGCLMMAAQQLAGINTVMYYAPKIIRMSGIRSDSLAVWLSVPLNTVYVIFGIFGCLITDRMNRRTLLLSSLMGVIVALIMLGAGFQMQADKMKTSSSSSSSSSNPIADTKTSDKCVDKIDCLSCIAAPRCGFCFNKQTPSEYSKCLDLDPLGHYSVSGPCKAAAAAQSSNSTNELDQYEFARHICPSSKESISASTWLVLLGLVTYLAFFAPGMSPMPWTINSEIYPMWARSACYSVATSVNWLFNMLVSFTFLSLIELLDAHGVFYMYAIISGVCWVILFFELPETRGRNLEDISRLFEARSDSASEHSESVSVCSDDKREQKSDETSDSIDDIAIVTSQMGVGAHRRSVVMVANELHFKDNKDKNKTSSHQADIETRAKTHNIEQSLKDN